MVTGGASGLGRAVALGAAQRGAKVVVADIDRATVTEERFSLGIQCEGSKGEEAARHASL